MLIDPKLSNAFLLFVGNHVIAQYRGVHGFPLLGHYKKCVMRDKHDLFFYMFELRKKLVKCYVWRIALYGVETWTLRAVDQKHLERFEMWSWRRMEKISWTDHVRNEDVLLRVKEQRNILHEIRKRLVTFCVETAFYNGLLKERYKWG